MKGTRDRRLCLKPALEHHYLAPFGAYLLPQRPIYSLKGVFIYQNNRWNVAVNSRYLPSGQKAISFGQKQSQRTI